ncbi:MULTISPECIES: LuxR C-terminal-related transcriptional regulator [unclassified Variovorax]|uniref:helix-turn-helix transcriptional regulator n=1 Tax=unclassified Variovorax TaxID=663243 RepID=UPI00076DB331|nr:MULTISPECIES: LuxR C-terminal-related transcriptional regulator [unclassified Variovorax]KWT69757.1 transcriptional regulatory protein [Variovorax sp. WDL1]PNG53367.1 putative HTH-type transcriptional regulator [Variovorax sp. B2]PNG53940.1 putative HTH-type transcriptional regulator [Variovorax sp. B4]VTV11409.1 transcriptional regulator NarL [Variovorax sp. WDL1]
MYLKASEQQALRDIFALLAEDQGESEIRERLGWALLDLLRADQFASFVWDADSGTFGKRVALNMAPSNLDRYAQWHQHHDPITFVLQSRRRATRVTEVMPQRALMRTAFFNDFLSRDGLHWGMNLHAFDGERALGDLRIWRRRGRGDFGAHETALLDLVEPAFIGALRRAQRNASPAATREAAWASLSVREQQVARAVCEGLTDKEIARRARVGVPTVRTYLRRIFGKLGIERRSALAAWVPGR